MYLQENNLHIFDIDDTLFHTNAKVKVVNHHGKVIHRLSNSEFNDHTLHHGHSYDFSEFRSADKFHHESKPIPKMLNKLKAIHKNIKNRSGSKSKVIMNTARADFDDKNKFLDTFRKHNVDIDNIHVHRAGNIEGNEKPAVKKVKIIKKHLESGDYKHAHMYDDSTTNLEHFLRMKKDHPHVQFHAWHVQHDGTMKKYHSRDEIKEDAPVNAAGSGNIAGIGVGLQGEPPGPKNILTRMLRRKKFKQPKHEEKIQSVNEAMFAGNEVFVVPTQYYHNCREGKNRYHSYEKYVGNDEIGEKIRKYGRDRKNRNKPIIVQDEKTGAMTYLRYGGKHRKNHT